MYLSQVAPEDMPESVRATWEQAGPGGKKFIAAMAHAPEHAEPRLDLSVREPLTRRG